MENIFKSQTIHFYRHSNSFYLRNGTLHELTQGCGNSIISKLHGKTDDEAEIMINELYSSGAIKDKPVSKDDNGQVRERVEPNIFRELMHGEPNGKFYVRKKMQGKNINKVFYSLAEARRFLNDYAIPETVAKYIYKYERKKGFVYRFKKKINGSTVHRSFKTLEEATAFRNEILNLY